MTLDIILQNTKFYLCVYDTISTKFLGRNKKNSDHTVKQGNQ